MSQLRKREHGCETGAASTLMDIIQNNIGFKLKVERGMAAPFKVEDPSGPRLIKPTHRTGC